MRIQHNITALDAANRLKSNESTVAKNIQKLSSGYRINSAADDAAGLAVSEKMRKQINGLSQAEDNTKNGISLVQTAEGGLNETSSILQRMNTLAVESSNGTYREADRKNLQMEVESLKTEIDRISTSTKFNEISLLNGDLSATAANANAVVAASSYGAAITSSGATGESSKLSANLAAFAADGDVHTFTVNYLDDKGVNQSSTIELKEAIGTDATKTKLSYSLNGSDWTQGYENTADGATAADTGGAEKALAAAITADTAKSGKAFTATVDSTNLVLTSNTTGAEGEHVLTVMQETPAAPTATSVAYHRTAGADAATAVDFSTAKVYDGSQQAVDVEFTVGKSKFAFVKDTASDTDIAKLGEDVYTIKTTEATNPSADDVKAMADLIQSKTGGNVTIDAGNTKELHIGASKAGSALVFQVGAENVDDQRASLNIDNMNAMSLGLANLDISKQSGAQTAIDVISAASAKVSTARAQLGALQNELEHTANNLGTMSQNLTSAESTIRDVDMTDEYVQYSKNQILSQAANSMLAQANAQPQSVLSLLKG